MTLYAASCDNILSVWDGSGRETMAEKVDEGAGMGDSTAEVVVLVGGDHVAELVYILGDVAVVIEGRKVELTVARHGKQATDATRTLKRIGKVEPPEVLYFKCVGYAAVD